MPVKEFTGQLDQPKIREFTGELDSDFNRETTGTDRMRSAISESRAAASSHPLPSNFNDGVQRVGPSTSGFTPYPNQGQMALENQAARLDKQSGGNIRGPWMDRPENVQAMRGPLLGVATALATGGASAPLSVGRLAIESVAQGGAGAVSEFANQREQGISDPGAIAKEAGIVGAGNFAAPVLMKGVANGFKKMFSTPLDAETAQSAKFAKDNKLKFPLSSAVPGSKAGNTQAASNILLPGQLKNISDARQVAVFLNQKLGTLTKDANVIQASAENGQKLLREVFAPGETAYTETFRGYRELVGDDTPIPLTKSVEVIRNAANALKARGESGKITNRLMQLSGIDPKADDAVSKLNAKVTDARGKLKVLQAKLDSGGNKSVIEAQMAQWEDRLAEVKRQISEKTASKGTAQLTAKQADELYTGLLRDVGGQATATGEMGAVLKALEADLDTVGKAYGANFAEDAAMMKADRDKWRELRKVPGLERLSKGFGEGGVKDGGEWLDGLFVNPNGKALSKFRELAPEQYHDVADAWLAKNIQKFSRQTDGSIGTVLDGRALRTWYVANKDRVKLIFGSDQAEALDNFSLYAHYMANAAKSADNRPSNMQLATRFLGEMGAVTGAPIPGMPIPGIPGIVVPSQIAAFGIARGLSDPSSSLFKVFTEGFDPKTRNFMLMTGQLAGREGARAGN